MLCFSLEFGILFIVIIMTQELWDSSNAFDHWTLRTGPTFPLKSIVWIRAVIDRYFLPIRLSINVLLIWYFDWIQIYVTFNC